MSTTLNHLLISTIRQQIPPDFADRSLDDRLRAGDWCERWQELATMQPDELRAIRWGWGSKLYAEWQAWLQSQPHTKFGVRSARSSTK